MTEPSSSFVFAPPKLPSLPVRGKDARFPVRRIFCVARNYAAHAREMGGSPDREPPFFFTKPADAVVQPGSVISYPQLTADLHHEVEMVAALGAGGRDLEPAEALELVYGYAVGLDMTRRDLQAEAKAAARPWDLAKGFDDSAPVSEIVPVSEIGHPSCGAIYCDVQGTRKQSGDLSDMIWSVAEILATLSRAFELRAGDLVFTGTPSGVGPVARGESVRCVVEGVGELTVSYT